MPLKNYKSKPEKKSNYVQAKLKFTTKSQKLEGLREMFSETLRRWALTVQIWVSLFFVPLPTKHPLSLLLPQRGKTFHFN